MIVYGINDIDGLGPIRPTEPAKSAKPSTRVTAASDPSVKNDHADISSQQQEQARVHEAARLVLNALPDVRADKVEMARKRLEDGYYDRPEIQAKIVEAVLRDPEKLSLDGLSPERRAEIAQRLRSGYYDNPNVIDDIANGLLEDAGED